MTTDVRDVRFEIDKNQGWPKLHDDGLADMRIAGKGMTIAMNLATASAAPANPTGSRHKHQHPTKEGKLMLDPRYVRVKIDRLSLHMHDTRRHTLLYKMAGPFVAARVKRAIERSIRDQIVATVTRLDALTRGLSSGLFAA